MLGYVTPLMALSLEGCPIRLCTIAWICQNLNLLLHLHHFTYRRYRMSYPSNITLLSFTWPNQTMITNAIL